jgi:hypothetical protein
MSGRKPPKLATWLVNTFDPGRHRGALAGDLFEEFRNGRSRAWFWRQTVLIVALRIGSEAFSLRNLALGAYGFFLLALPDCVFGLLNRPPQPPWIANLAEWVVGILLVAWLLASRDWKKQPPSRWEAALFLAALLALQWIDAWVSTDSLGTRLRTDAHLCGFLWIFLTIFEAKRRVRLRKP